MSTRPTESVAEPEQREPAVQEALEDLARSLHASYLQRWGRHDPAGLERFAGKAPTPEGRITAA